MKYIIIFFILSLCSCAGDIMSDVDSPIVNPNAISFNVTTRITSNVTRAQFSDDGNSSNELQPLVLKSAELDMPLYLHTYIAEECESGANETVTRAAQVNDLTDFVALNKIDGFYIEAYDDGNDIFIPQYTTAKPQSDDPSENLWNTSPLYYWPADNRSLGFYAYAPMSAYGLLENIRTDNSDKTISFDYEVPKGTVVNDYHNDAEVQPDIMFAITECSKPASVDGKVPMNFRHALSAIKFAVRDVVGGTIEQISITGVAGEAHCIYIKTETPEADMFEWSEHSQPQSTYTQTFNYKTTDKTSGDEVLNEQMPSKTFLMIPQEIPDDAKIEIVFKRDSDSQTFTMSGNIRDNDVTEWEPGKEYIYTISTSSSNWIYYFEVLGSEQAINDDEPTKGVFSDAHQIVLNQTVTEGAYYKVKSYRVRANNLNYTEPVAWKVSQISTGVTTKPDNFNFDIATPPVAPDTWIPTKTMSGAGSTDFTKYDLVFCPQITGTDYPGDWDLKARAEIGSAISPYDLSMTYGSMNTANCYVINASGYFKLPLVYGNAIKNGQTNSSCYKYTDPGTYSNKSLYPPLTQFTDYQGKAITTPKIEGAKDAILVWEDAYNVISDVKLNLGDGTYGTISFKVNKENLQQGNAVIAVRDANQDIIWSWHIWITDHWTNEGSLQLTGDVVLPAYDAGMVSGDRFYAAPRNLGWCDPKNIWYLKRTGTISFVQDKSGKSASLPVEQRERKIEYWIGNNTYYQFGRKDPMVGFMNISHVVKYNFGTYPYELNNQPVDIKSGIQHPNILFVGGTTHNSSGIGYDWLSTHYQNLWNNAGNFSTTSPTATNKIPYHYSGVKTVYDPCPAGYMVPPVGFFKYITKANDDDVANSLVFNGVEGRDERNQIIYKVQSSTPGEFLILYGTGHRWYASGGDVPAGGNFNPQIAYLWSSHIVFNNGNAYGLALGGSDNTSNFRFIGRRAMARPIRPIKEL